MLHAAPKAASGVIPSHGLAGLHVVCAAGAGTEEQCRRVRALLQSCVSETGQPPLPLPTNEAKKEE